MKKVITMTLVSILLIGVFAIVSPIEICGATEGDTLYVGGTRPGNYSSIQDAIFASSNGDTVYVYSGIYNEYLWVDKSINLIGENRDTTIIDGRWGNVVHIGADWVNITGFTLQNGTGTAGIEVYSLNNTISGNTITNNRCGVRIYLSPPWAFYGNITGYNTISGNTITGNNEDGIYLEYASNTTIIGNNITNNNNSGIFLGDMSYNNTISSNNITNNGDCGINQTWMSYLNNISSNIIKKNNKHGINLIMAYYNNISGNTITENNEDGINLSGRYNTIYKNSITNSGNCGISLMAMSELNNITNNTITNNSQFGIYLFFSLSNSIKENTIKENSYGVYTKNFSAYKNLSGFENLSGFIDTNNTIHHNKFINNNQNAYDECNNTWDNGYPSGGNYWSDYTGVDADGDGIGDSPYDIPGGYNRDIYPLGYFKKEESAGKTPGFEFVFAVFAIVFVLFWKRKR